MKRMSSHPFKAELSELSEHYSQLVENHGDTAPAVQWTDRETQERRLAILTEVGDLRSAKVLDFGCGLGQLLLFMARELAFTGEYVGYDLSARMIATAREKFPESRFERRDVLEEGIPEDFDYILISGVFNNYVAGGWDLMTVLLSSLFQHTRKAIAFNALSTYVDFFDPRLFYVNPERVFRFCKERLSPCVCLRHDYLIKTGVVPFEFSMYVYKTDLESRKNLRPEISVSRE
jgi:SAM-dependent methyltransferase